MLSQRTKRKSQSPSDRLDTPSSSRQSAIAIEESRRANRTRRRCWLLRTSVSFHGCCTRTGLLIRKLFKLTNEISSRLCSWKTLPSEPLRWRLSTKYFHPEKFCSSENFLAVGKSLKWCQRQFAHVAVMLNLFCTFFNFLRPVNGLCCFLSHNFTFVATPTVSYFWPCFVIRSARIMRCLFSLRHSEGKLLL